MFYISHDVDKLYRNKKNNKTKLMFSVKIIIEVQKKKIINKHFSTK